VPAVPPISRSADTLSLDSVRSRWPEVLDIVAKKKRVLREALGRATPSSLGDGSLTLEVANQVDLEGLERGRSAVADAIAEIWGQRIQVVLRTNLADVTALPAEPQRLDRRGDAQERLQVYRSKDQALDTAAELLDLELTD